MDGKILCLLVASTLVLAFFQAEVEANNYRYRSYGRYRPRPFSRGSYQGYGGYRRGSRYGGPGPFQGYGLGPQMGQNQGFGYGSRIGSYGGPGPQYRGGYGSYSQGSFRGGYGSYSQGSFGGGFSGYRRGPYGGYDRNNNNNGYNNGQGYRMMY